MAFGFPAYHTECYPTSVDQLSDLRVAVRAVLGGLSWHIREESGDRVVASTGINMRSWGETVVIAFLPDRSLSITSKCALPTQCLDWGRNKANVRKFMAEFGRYSSAQSGGRL